MKICIKTMNEDDDKEVVAHACLNVVDIVKDCGYMAIESYMRELVAATLLLLQEKSACQQEESDSDDDDTSHDEVLMDAVFDLLPAYAKCMGPHFGPVFAKLFEPSMKFAKASRPPQDRTMVVACLAEVTQEMGAPIASYVDVSPSTLNFHGHSFRQDLSLQTSVPFTPNSHALVAVRSTDIPYASAPRGTESSYRTPAPQGRSALYSMTRTPYSRVHPTAMLKVNGSMTKEKAGLLTSSQMSWKNNLLLSGGKQAFKRRNFVLDSDIGSIGPIRRTRRKTDMMFSSQSTGLSSSLRKPFTPFCSDAATGPISTQNQFQLQGPKHITSVRGIMESGESSSAGRGSVCVPDQSRETAQKILQQLEKIAPSPKGKSCETTTLETSPSRFMPDVLNGQGIKTTEGVHSSKLQNTHVRGIWVV